MLREMRCSDLVMVDLARRGLCLSTIAAWAKEKEQSFVNH